MKKKILGILICGILILGMTGCGNSSEKGKESNNDKSGMTEKDKNQKSEKEKVVVCKKDHINQRTETVYLKGDKLVKIVNSVDDVDCEGIKRIFGSLNDIKGTSVTITCSENGKEAHHEETYIVDEIEDINVLDGERFPNQLGGAYFDEETHKFDLKFWLEGKNTQNFTCEESESN